MKQQESTLPDNNSGLDINTDENLSGTTHLNEPVSEESELEKLRTELEESKEWKVELLFFFEFGQCKYRVY